MFTSSSRAWRVPFPAVVAVSTRLRAHARDRDSVSHQAADDPGGRCAVVLVVVAVVYLTMSHPKHALLFFGLAVLALLGAWFSTGESARKS